MTSPMDDMMRAQAGIRPTGPPAASAADDEGAEAPAMQQCMDKMQAALDEMRSMMGGQDMPPMRGAPR